MNALEAQEIRRRVEKEFKRDDGLKQLNIFEKYSFSINYNHTKRQVRGA